MKITILAIGKKHDPKLQSAILEYSKRLSHYVSIQWRLTEAKLTPSMSEPEIRNSESKVLLEQLNLEDKVILLYEDGKTISTTELSENLQNYMNHGTKTLVFIIGGAYGVNQGLFNRADFVWSLSNLVFPHQLVRLILIEQLYRAHTILAGKKYHHI